MPKVKWLGACNNVHRMRFVAHCFASVHPSPHHLSPVSLCLARKLQRLRLLATCGNLCASVQLLLMAIEENCGLLPTVPAVPPLRAAPFLTTAAAPAAVAPGNFAWWWYKSRIAGITYVNQSALLDSRGLCAKVQVFPASNTSNNNNNSNNKYYKILAINTRVCNPKKY